MFTKRNRFGAILPTVFFFLSISFGIISLAGPTWHKKEIPGIQSNASLVILMDLSRSMLVKDVQPNRLERSKLKVRDLLDANPGARTALYVFAGTVHPVMTLTPDYRLIKHHVDHLETSIMPVPGSDLDLAMIEMDTIFGKFKAPSTLLIITDEIAYNQTSSLLRFVDHSDHRIEILNISTNSGGPIPSFSRNQYFQDETGDLIISKPDQSILTSLNNNERINVIPITLDKSDVEGIAERVRRKLVFQEDETISQDEWQDMGLWFLIPALFFSLFFFRKGWMIHWCVLITLSSFSSCQPESKYADIWYTADYKGKIFETKNKYQEAAETYSDLNHKAVAFYKAGNFEAAANLFSMDSSAAGSYNYGMALASLGRYEEARIALEVSASKDPSLDNVQKHLNEIGKAISQVDSVNRFSDSAQSDNKVKKEDEPLIERQAKGKDEELTSDTETDKLPESGDRVTDEIETDIRTAKEMDSPPENFETGGEMDPQKIMLRTISADPKEFLKRRFKFQKDKYYPNKKPGKQKW